MVITTETPEEIVVVDEDVVNVVSSAVDYSSVDYIVFISEEDNNSFELIGSNMDFGCWNMTLYYSFDGENYSEITPRTPIQFNDRLYVKGSGATDAMGLSESDEDGGYVSFTLSKDAVVKGNILALLDWENFSTMNSLPAYAFYRLFNNNTHLTDASELTMPAFVFDFCYDHMFYGCTSLTAAPTLPATSLEEGCYRYMFSGCSSLTSVICLAANVSSNRISSWLNDTAASGIFYKNPNATCWTVGTNVPSGWTIVDYTE